MDLRDAVEASDHATLLRIVDVRVGDRDWDGLIEVRERCLEAVERGKQLWGVAHHVDYRLALHAPAEWAGPVVDERSRPLLGPLTEVVASTHTWEELAGHLRTGPSRTHVAAERVLWGEDLREDASIEYPELPLRLEPWEPRYTLPEYRSDRVEAPTPLVPQGEIVDLDAAVRRDDEDDALWSLHQVAAPWGEDSNGRCEVVCVEGEAGAAIHEFGLRQARLAVVEPQQALAVMQWAAASGGAHGKRRGGAAGRFITWWAVAHLAGFEELPAPDEMGEALSELRWYVWSDLFPEQGWHCRLAIEDPAHGLAFAINAFDLFMEADEAVDRRP